MRILYTIGLYLYAMIAHLVAIRNAKAKQWIKGRKQSFSRLEQVFKHNTQPVIWFHAASLGEFEQGRPVIEAFKKKHPNYKILLTFFSPSGYNVRKQYEFADCIVYLPLDTPRNAKRLINIVKPTCTVFIKYEFWFNFLHRLHKRHIKICFISVIFRKNQYFFKPLCGWFRKQLRNIDYFFVQNEESVNLLQSIGITNVSISGDTRFDRVAAIAMQNKPIDLIAKFKGQKKLLVVGSSWVKDERLIASIIPNLEQEFQFLIVPHEIDEIHLSRLALLIAQPTVWFSHSDEENLSDYRVMIVDEIGWLSQMYRYADIAYIGGGFGKGIHNTLEPAVFGIPLFFGTNYRKFQEACDMVDLGGAFVVSDAPMMLSKIQRLMNNPKDYDTVCTTVKQYVARNIGATERIMAKLSEWQQTA
ncbi:3-deoxy-D-manno-octulosonic acid transferase [Bacteroidia bacterium]|nr:3-deoxy-D-manno-octulosonic acid transferase [Bacteroidia bacterium]